MKIKGLSCSDHDLVVFAVLPIPIAFISPVLSRDDLIRRENLVKGLRINQIQIAFDILSNGRFLRNDTMRCRCCKMKMIGGHKKDALKQGLDHVVDGSNLDNMKDHQPDPCPLP